MKRLIISAAAVALLMTFCISASAATVAYWRFEEGTNDTIAPVYWSQGNHMWYQDSSGNNNMMCTWDWFTSPRYTNGVPFHAVPQTGMTNTLGIWCGGGDPPSINDDIWSEARAINSHDFSSGWTVEASIKTFDTGRWQIFVGKDGKPGTGAFPPLGLKFNVAEQKLELLFVDGGTNERSVFSGITFSGGQWYDVAAVCDGSVAQLYIKEASDIVYELEGTISNVTGGALVDVDSNWTIGRGCWNGGNADWADALIDEVRVSDSALSPSAFLGVVPEPGAMIAVVGALLALFARRR